MILRPPGHLFLLKECVHMSDRSSKPVDGRKLGFDEQAVFCRQLAFVVKAGIPLSGAYEFLKTEAEDDDNIRIVERVFDNLEGGSFADAMLKTGCFSDYLVSVVRLGEKTGNLEKTLYDLADYFEQRAVIKRRVRQAFTYPLILLVMMTAVILFLIIEVLPQFAQIIAGSGGTIPATAAGILGFGMWIRNFYPYILAVIAAIVAAVIIFRMSGFGKRCNDRLSLTSIGFGKTTRKLATARFCSAMRMSLSCGNSFPDAVALSADISGNSEVKRRLLKLRSLINAGGEIPKSMSEIDLFPKSFVSLFATAYRTGNLDETLGRMSEYYQADYDDSVYSITSRIEPILVIVLSCIAGIILFSVMMPIINIMQLVG